MIKILILIVCFFFLLFHFRMIESERENFIDNMKKINREHFENHIPSVRDIEDEKTETTEIAGDEGYEKPLDPKKVENTIVEEPVIPEEVDKPAKPEVCQKKGSKGEGCLFGCPDDKEVKPVKPVKMDLDEMMMTIEDTEKICDMIEEKDRIRKEKEDQDSVKKQVELNRKFLIQQKAQNKQIKDLEAIVKSMGFTHDMNKAAVEKCGKSADDCLSEKERTLKQMLMQKQKNSKSVKINLNLKDFGNEFLGHLTKKIGLSGTELEKLLQGMKDGKLDLQELQSQMGFNNGGNNSMRVQYMDDEDCPSCNVDLSEYIDRCKIPCHKCRDPKWKCPQDIQN